jgi:hypothetical protein
MFLIHICSLLIGVATLGAVKCWESGPLSLARTVEGATGQSYYQLTYILKLS